MMKKNFILFTTVSLLAFLCLAGLAAQPYTLTVTSTNGFKYYGGSESGSMSGIVYDRTYTISRDSPFTVILVPITQSVSTFGCGGISSTYGYYIYLDELSTWRVNGTDIASPRATVSVDEEQPAATASAYWRNTLTGDGYFNMNNPGIIFWFCSPAIKAYTGGTFTSDFVAYTGAVTASGNYACEVGYDASRLQVTSVTNNSPGAIATVDYATPGLIKFTGACTGGRDTATVTWQALRSGEVNLPINVTSFTDRYGNPTTINGKAAVGYGGINIKIINHTHAFGDVDGDGNISIVDALAVARHSSGIQVSGLESAAADVNLDGAITVVDAMIIAKYNAGLVTSLPAFN